MKAQPQLQYQQGKVEFYLADAIDLLADLKEKPSLIFMDPPFNIGVNYVETNDSLPEQDYYDLLDGCIAGAANNLDQFGSFWINIPDSHAAEVVVKAKAYDFTLENWCIWHYRFGVWQPSRFINSKTHALWFSNGDPRVNPETAKVPSLRASLYNDIRASEGLTSGERMDFDVWGFDQYWGRVQGNNKERVPLHANQLPEVYLERVIRLCSDPGDLVVDPFCGSGTTATVANALDRRVITGDINPDYLTSAMERVKRGPVRVQP